MIPDRLTIRLGDLRRPLEERLASTGCAASTYLRRLIATDLGVPEPEMPVGDPTIGERLSEMALRARWGASRNKCDAAD